MNKMDKRKLAGQVLNRLEKSNHGKIMLSIKKIGKLVPPLAKIKWLSVAMPIMDPHYIRFFHSMKSLVSNVFFMADKSAVSIQTASHNNEAFTV